MLEDELSSVVGSFRNNRHRSYRYIREYQTSSARNNRSYAEQFLQSANRASIMEQTGLGTISHPTGDSIKCTTVACDNFSHSYRIIELDKDAILQLIENAITQGKISHRDIILLFAKLKGAKSNAQ